MKEKNRNKKRGRTALLVVLSVLLCLLLAGGVLAYRFRAELSALLLAMRSSPEEVAALQSENDAHISELLDKLTDPEKITLRDLTEEERKSLAKGELSEADALSLIRGEKTLEEIRAGAQPGGDAPGTAPLPGGPISPELPGAQPGTDPGTQPGSQPGVTPGANPGIQPGTNPGTQPGTQPGAQPGVKPGTDPGSQPGQQPSAPASDPQSRIDDLLAQIYLLRASYLNEIDALIARYKDEYKALPKEQRGTQTKLSFTERIVEDAHTLEAECDAKLDTILAQMKPLLLKLNGQTELLAEIRTAYAEQKRLKKAEILNKYNQYVN